MSDEPDSGRADGQNPLENTGAQESSMEREPATPDAIASEQQAKERSTRPGLVMLSGLLVAAAAFGTTLLTWVDARITGAFGEQSLAVSGSKAAPAVSALALVALAAPLAGRIAPRLLRYVVYGVAAAAGVGIVLSVIGLRSPPAPGMLGAGMSVQPRVVSIRRTGTWMRWTLGIRSAGERTPPPGDPVCPLFFVFGVLNSALARDMS